MHESISNAKIGRNLADNKLSHDFFLMLLRQEG
jgi:hypothetical protein